MVMPIKSRRCLICCQWFTPHPQTAKIQKVCSQKSCQNARRNKNWQEWVKSNPDYYRSHSRRRQVQSWAKGYPDYWQDYRKSHPEYVKQDNLRRAKALKRQRCSAKQIAWKQQPLGKLRNLQALNPQECSAKQIGWDPRVNGILEFLISRENGLVSAKPIAIDIQGAAGA
jgi:hypothetical protein